MSSTTAFNESRTTGRPDDDRIKVVYLPLDERPCNYDYPIALAGMTDLRLIVPDRGLLGDKKQAADTAALAAWMEAAAANAQYALLSIDMLVYGGIVPSRLHEWSPSECQARLAILRRLKLHNPHLRLFAFNLITRAPAYSSSEEEPDYYALHGRELNVYGKLRDKGERETLSPEEEQELEAARRSIPVEILSDFLTRRRTNAFVNEQAIGLAREGIIDFLIIPLDDNAKYGYTSADQRKLTSLVERENLTGKVHIYPGADEIGCTLFARIVCETAGFLPTFHLRFSSSIGPSCIPKYEDRSLNESIKCHLTAAGAVIGDSSDPADVYLMVHSPPVGQADMAETTDRYEDRHRSYYSEVNVREFVQAIRHYASRGRLIALADVALCNGGDHSLMKLLSEEGLLGSISCYAAWNTSGNSLGTVISHAIIEAYNRSKAESERVPEAAAKSRDYYLYRLLEDWGYQSIVRQELCERELPALHADYFRISHVQEQIEAMIGPRLEQFSRKYFPEFGELRVSEVRLPWKRMFEVGFRLETTTLSLAE
ncbi:DUF4127 family protein [Cohnella fermenti]|uniref:DUF4127 family protein n=1 Tax=Cohnella fermenti TaxID=2565925 RepID=A0A4S4C2L1_9BACL|nr:DUF4127 family protein [Cohnella fermenti]THF81759.1 DUF4127 family protein [Cohnella fermenti]